MDAITVRCKMCKHAMKFSAEKAGKRAKCPKCDTIVLIVAEEEAKKPEPETAVAAGAASPAPAASPAADDEYGTPVGYDVTLDPELEERRKEREAEEKAKKKKDRKKLPKMGRKIKAIPDAESWNKVRIGLLFVLIGTWIWFGCHVLQGMYVVLGMVEYSEYATVIATNLEMRNGADLPEKGEFWDVDQLDIHLGMIAGRDFVGFARVCITIATIFYFIHAICWLTGHSIALSVPPRFGAFSQLIISLVLGGINLITMFVFKLLPVCGIMAYVMIPFVVPEIAMTEYNMERIIPIQVMWSPAPFWENSVNLLLIMALYFQPAMGTIFIWSIGISLKDDTVTQKGWGLSELCLGTLFALFTYHMLSICGASPVLVWVLRVIYTVWYCFLLLFILRYALLLQKTRAVLYDKINPKNELEE
jgi:hypothetical protein